MASFIDRGDNMRDKLKRLTPEERTMLQYLEEADTDLKLMVNRVLAERYNIDPIKFHIGYKYNYLYMEAEYKGDIDSPVIDDG